jgi:DNA-binding transcriptional ArsR family regulator
MSTKTEISILGTTLFGKTRRAVLALLYSHPDESFYLRQIARTTGAGMGALQRELKQLSEAGVIQRSEIGQQAFFKANADCPVFQELSNLIIKTFGVQTENRRHHRSFHLDAGAAQQGTTGHGKTLETA